MTILDQVPTAPRPSFEATALQRALGDRVRELRKARGWSQEDLVERSGMDRSFIAQIENGHRNLSLKSIARLAHGLQVEIADLFRFETKPR